MSEQLDEKLSEYAKSGAIPFHMPGHKRVCLKSFDPYKIDITEIPGFDDLHEPSGVIEKLQRDYANLYGAKNAYISVNGSTLGNLAAIFSATERGDEIIVGKNCHRSVDHAAELNGLLVHYIDPEEAREITPGEGVVSYDDTASSASDFSDHIPGRITPDQIKRALDVYPKTKLIVITSPTYEGIVSDIPEIARIAHERDVLVHVDGAHGAHHGLGGLWQQSIIAPGKEKEAPDTAVLSLHKTLPAFTSSSILLRSEKSRVSDEKINHYLDCFETSSPSYILMYGMALCLNYINENSTKLFEDYKDRLEDFYEAVAGLKNIRVRRFYDQDISKIIISKNGKMSGEEIAERLRVDHNIETEKTGRTYCLALSSVMDTAENFKKLADALYEQDNNDQ